MALRLARTFLERELPAGAVRVIPDPAVKRHRDQHLAERVGRILADGRDVVVDAPSRTTRRAVMTAAAGHRARLIGYWARPPKLGMPWILEYEPEYSQLSRRPRKADGFDALFEIVDPEQEYRLREL
ncbi:hypothetical protein [Micromonospora sp. WMMD812]|uniref:hypothetical protein n=1 Tax=Micromonospora sp. WMMD812 TaxID=3015152 RepID=UPI00248B4693|nr:hypothetical protein [Micromonospora sp. WMMD812]WBB70093.1 hypothetical protein O7603_12310 [Micromonospora sp. WMMD812]